MLRCSYLLCRVNADLVRACLHEQFLALQSMYMKSGHGFILVFSLTSMETVADLQNVSSRPSAGISRFRSAPVNLLLPFH